MPISLLIAVPVVPNDGKTFARLAAGLGVGAHRIPPAETDRPGGAVRAAAVTRTPVDEQGVPALRRDV